MSGLSKRETEVLVVGAGPSGLTMACELLRHGVPCRIIDQDEGPTVQTRALGLQTRTLEVFSNMGVIDEVLDKGKRVYGLNAYADNHRIAHVSFDSGDDTPYPFTVHLPQSQTEPILIGSLAKRGLEVERQVQLKAFTEDESGVTATLADALGHEQSLRTGWLIGCDGGHSTVRHLLNLPFEGGNEEKALMAEVRIDWSLPDDEIHVFLTPDGTVGAFPFPEPERWRLVYTGGADMTEEPEEAAKFFQKRINNHGVWGVVVSDATYVSVYGIHRRMVPQFRKGRCFLAGDAAHVHSPAGAQGLNTAIQDSFNLAWKLGLVVAKAAPESLLDSYQAERHPVAAGVLGGSDVTTRIVALRNPVLQQIRNQLIAFLSNFNIVQHRISRGMGELALSYRKSPIVAEDRAWLPPHSHHNSVIPGLGEYLDFGAAPSSGERAPDVVIGASVGNTAKRLFEVLKGTHHTLLLFAGAAPTLEEYQTFESIGHLLHKSYDERIFVHIVVPFNTVPDELRWGASTVGGFPSVGDWRPALLLDADGALHHRYGAGSQCLYLIRPDGYVGYRSQPVDTDKLLAYLKRLFV